MTAQLNIMIAITFSMLITLTTICIFEPLKANHSVVQYIINQMHISALTKSCSYQDILNCQMCEDLVIVDDYYHYAENIFIITISLIIIVLLCYGMQAFNYIRMILYTILIVWLLSRYCDNNTSNCWYQLDILIIYFIIWQFMYLMCKWEFVDLSWPLLILQQAACCVSTSITAFFSYDIFFRYVPFQFKIAFLWLMSLYDVFECFRVNGRFYKMTKLYESKKVIPPDTYFTFDIEDEENDTNCKAMLGLGDFNIYNLMLLSIMDLDWSLTTKLFVGFGCIICILVGDYGTGFIRKIWQTRVMPGVPFPVVIFSLYIIIIDFVMNYTTNNCINV